MKSIFKYTLAAILALAICLSLCACYEVSIGGINIDGIDLGGDRDDHGDDGDKEVHKVAEGDLEIHFLELGNKYTGDCTYIKAGDKDILIDAGSRASSVSTINDYISKYVTDGTLEYVIVTHAHQDHYAGFATTEKQTSLFDLFKCEVIIDFAQVTAERVGKTQYNHYLRERDAEIAEGAVHYTADQAVATNGGVFELGNGISFTVLDSYFYYNRSTNENDHSVCILLEDGANSYLFTGDLETEGEEKLIEMNDLPKVKLYKAGHHGSKTSSSEALLSVIQPEIVTVCCCCGSPEYTDINENQFPTQQFINRVAVYTDAVYVTTLCVDYQNSEFTSMNGNITIISKKGSVSLEFSGNSKKLKESKWFKENRIIPNEWK